MEELGDRRWELVVGGHVGDNGRQPESQPEKELCQALLWRIASSIFKNT